LRVCTSESNAPKEVAINIRLVDIQNIEDISNKKTQMLEGEFGQRRLLPYAFRFAPEFYDDLMRHYTVIPLQILRAFAGSPIEHSIARWLYRRIVHTQKPTLVRWADIHAERGGGIQTLDEFAPTPAQSYSGSR
jgi:hypothetical protein